MPRACSLALRAVTAVLGLARQSERPDTLEKPPYPTSTATTVLTTAAARIAPQNHRATRARASCHSAPSPTSEAIGARAMPYLPSFQNHDVGKAAYRKGKMTKLPTRTRASGTRRATVIIAATRPAER